LTTTIQKKKKKKAKTKKVKKKVKKKSKKAKKKPRWEVVTYEQIETRRAELGISKSAMAVMLGVTNSTYPGPSVVAPQKTSGKNGKNGTGRWQRPNKSDIFGFQPEQFDDGDGNIQPGRRVTVGGKRCNTPNDESSLPITRHPGGMIPSSVAVARNIAVSNITRTFIDSKKGKASAGSVIDLVRELVRILP
jgi:hypothetical protein